MHVLALYNLALTVLELYMKHPPLLKNIKRILCYALYNSIRPFRTLAINIYVHITFYGTLSHCVL